MASRLFSSTYRPTSNHQLWAFSCERSSMCFHFRNTTKVALHPPPSYRYTQTMSTDAYAPIAHLALNVEPPRTEWMNMGLWKVCVSTSISDV